MRRWRRVKCCVDTAKGLGLLLVALAMKGLEEGRKRVRCVGLVVSFLLIWLIYSHLDPCRGRIITTNLCRDFFQGEVSGRLCPHLCRKETVQLSVCTENGDKKKSFWWESMLLRAPSALEHTGREVTLMEGMLPSEFVALLMDHLQLLLGPGDFHNLMNQLKTFADFNEDGKLSLGEAQSLWRLVQDREFLVLFIFQHSIIFPTINGTCGSMFSFQYPQEARLYDKDVFPLHLVSAEAYRWFLPTWEQRAKVGVGILDLMFDIYEDNHVRFFMCDVTPGVIGHTASHEAMVSDARHIFTSAMLANTLQNRSCSHDHHCHFSRYCTTVCDSLQGRCTGEVTKPSLWQACLLLKEYLLFDAPVSLQAPLDRLLQRCSHLIIYGQSIDMSHVILITDLKTILWDHIKNMNVM